MPFCDTRNGRFRYVYCLFSTFRCKKNIILWHQNWPFSLCILSFFQFSIQNLPFCDAKNGRFRCIYNLFSTFWWRDAKMAVFVTYTVFFSLFDPKNTFCDAKNGRFRYIYCLFSTFWWFFLAKIWILSNLKKFWSNGEKGTVNRFLFLRAVDWSNKTSMRTTGSWMEFWNHTHPTPPGLHFGIHFASIMHYMKQKREKSRKKKQQKSQNRLFFQ